MNEIVYSTILIGGYLICVITIYLIAKHFGYLKSQKKQEENK